MRFGSPPSSSVSPTDQIASPHLAASDLQNSVFPVPTMHEEIDPPRPPLLAAGEQTRRKIAGGLQVVEVRPREMCIKRQAKNRRRPFLARAVGPKHDLAQRRRDLQTAATAPDVRRFVVQAHGSAADKRAVRHDPPMHLARIGTDQDCNSLRYVAEAARDFIGKILELLVALVQENFGVDRIETELIARIERILLEAVPIRSGMRILLENVTQFAHQAPSLSTDRQIRFVFVVVGVGQPFEQIQPSQHYVFQHPHRGTEHAVTHIPAQLLPGRIGQVPHDPIHSSICRKRG